VEDVREVEEKLRKITQNYPTTERQAMLLGRSKTDLVRWVTVLMALNHYASHLVSQAKRGQRLEDADR